MTDGFRRKMNTTSFFFAQWEEKQRNSLLQDVVDNKYSHLFEGRVDKNEPSAEGS